MKPSTSPFMSGVGSKSTGTTSTSSGEMPFALRIAANTLALESCTPIFLPTRSAEVWMSAPSVSDRIVKGFFWNVAPMILSGASCSAIAAPIEAASERATCTVPESSFATPVSGPEMPMTSEKPASS